MSMKNAIVTYKGTVPSEPKAAVYENEIAVIPEGQLPVARYTDDDFTSAVSSGAWLPRLQLMTANSDLCKKGEFPVNHYALVRGSENIDLGTEVDTVILGWRPKALEFGEVVISVYDPKSEEFKRIAAKSEGKGSQAMFGPEFLVWLPGMNLYCTFFMCSATARREAPNVKARIGKAATLKAVKIEGREFTWFGPLCTACSTPLTPPDELMLETVEKFNNPPASEIEKDEAGATSGRAR